MHRSHGIAVAVTLTLAFGGVIGVASANAATSPRTDAQLVHPAMSNSSGEFFSSDQLQSVWTAVTTHYPRKLPAGVTFPQSPTPFFDPEPGAGKVLYQAGLVDQIVANYWECSWLKAGLSAERKGETEQLRTADAAVAAYGSLPSVSSGLDVANYRAAVSTYAKAAGISDLRQAEFEMECSK